MINSINPINNVLGMHCAQCMCTRMHPFIMNANDWQWLQFGFQVADALTL